MEPLFLAVICGCNAGLFREALHEVYIPRIQREDARFAANVLGARGTLLLVLVHFFEHGHWGSPAETGDPAQSLPAEDQLFIFMQAGMYLVATRGFASAEARICYERAEPLCVSLNRLSVLFVALIGQWRYSLHTEKLSAAMRIAKRVYSLAEEQHDSAVMIGACRVLACTFYFLGDFEVRATIRDARRSALALGSRTVFSRRGLVARCCLYDLWGAMPMAFRRDSLQPSGHGGRYLAGEGAE